MTEPPVLDDETMADSDGFTTHTNHRAKAPSGSSNAEGTVFKHSVLLSIGIPRQHSDTLNVRDKVIETFAMMIDHCDDIIIISDDGKQEIRTPKDFPATKEDFQTFFHPETQWTKNPRDRYSGKCSMKMTISSTKGFDQIKSGKFLTFLKQQGIHLSRHSISSTRSAKIGLFTKIHPSTTFLPKFRKRLHALIQEALTDGLDLPGGLTPHMALEIFLKIERIKHPGISEDINKAPTYIQTEAIFVYTNAEYATIMANLICSERIFPEEELGHFLPWSVRHENGLFANKLREHNAITSRIQTFKVEGVTRAMMESIVTYNNRTGKSSAIIATTRATTPKGKDNLSTNIYPRLCLFPEETKFTEDEGRWLIPYMQDEQQEAKQMIEHLIQQWSGQESTLQQTPRLASRGSRHPAQDYIDAQKSASIPAYVAQNPNKYNTFSQPRTYRPALEFEVSEISVSNQTWASIVRDNTVSTLGASQKSDVTHLQPLGPTRTTLSNNNSVASADTTQVTNRTDLELVVTQMRRDTEQVIQAYKTANEATIAEMKSTIQELQHQVQTQKQKETDEIKAQMEEIRRENNANMTLTNQIVKQISELMATMMTNTVDQSTITEMEANDEHEIQFNPIPDSELMQINEDELMTQQTIGYKRDAGDRTPLRTPNRARGRGRGRAGGRAYRQHPENLEPEYSQPKDQFPVRTELQQTGDSTEET